MRGVAGCWIDVMGEVGKDSYQYSRVNFGWIQE